MSMTSPALRAIPTLAVGTWLARMTRLSTLGMIRAGLVALGLTVSLFWLVAAFAIADARGGVQIIGHDTAPSVVAAQAIRAHLSNLDAEAANALLTRGSAQTKAWASYTAEQGLLSDFLVTAAQNITYGDKERNPILTISTGVQAYAGLIGVARASAESTLSESMAPDAALASIRLATNLLNTKLLPAAVALNDANETVLNNTWNGRKSAFFQDRAGLILGALPALVSLALLQIWLAAKTNRLLNPGLLAATLVMAVAALWALIGSGAAATALTSAKQDAFDSVRAIWKARAVAYSANADESYFLLDSPNKQNYATAFQAKIVDLTDRDFLAKAARDRYIDRRVTPFQRMACGGGTKPEFKGLLGDELLNVTFEGECAAAVGSYTALAAYLDVDEKMRGLDRAGLRDAAIALDVGTDTGDSNHAFGLFDKALQKIIDINQSAFDASIARAESDLAPLPWIAGFGGAAVWLLAFLGLRPRLNEYRA
jgi:hypothetical protein